MFNEYWNDVKCRLAAHLDPTLSYNKCFNNNVVTFSRGVKYTSQIPLCQQFFLVIVLSVIHPSRIAGLK